MIVIVVRAEHIRGAPTAIHPACTGVQPLRAVSARQRGKRIHDIHGAAHPVHTEVDVIGGPLAARTAAAVPSSSSKRTKSWPSARTKIVNDPEVHGIGVAVI